MSKQPSKIVQAYADEVAHVLRKLVQEKRISSDIGMKHFEGGLIQIRIAAPGTQHLEMFGNDMAVIVKELEDEGLLENDIIPVIIEWKVVGLFGRHINVRPLPSKVEEDINILRALAVEIIATFKLAEETHFQEKGKQWPYEVNLQVGRDTCRIHVLRGPRNPRSQAEPFSTVVGRLYDVSREVLDHTLFDVELVRVVSMNTGSVSLRLKDL